MLYYIFVDTGIIERKVSQIRQTESSGRQMRKKSNSKKVISKSLLKPDKWELSRRRFILSSALGAAAMQLPIGRIVGQQSNQQSVLDSNQKDILKSVQEILLPKDGNGPGASVINALDYLIWVLSDAEKDPEEVQYIKDGIGWVDETAEEDRGKAYMELSQIEREQLIEEISRESWGESWLSVILSFIFEALLCDPQYGGNPDRIGWNWLSHNPGQPRPSEVLLYPNILKQKRKPD